MPDAALAPLAPAAMPCPLWEGVRRPGLRTVAVMGMAKNTGKTVCLNHLLAQAHAARVTVGLTSIGRDGEARDEVFAFPKPPVRVAAGCLVATARDTLRRARIRTRTLFDTRLASPMGDILIVQAHEAGEMEVAGPSHAQAQRQVLALLRQCGADKVFIDGALGRSLHASPSIADGVVLATGAALGGGMGDVLRKTAERLALLGIPAAPAELVRQVRTGLMRGDETVHGGTEDAVNAAALPPDAGIGLWWRDGRFTRLPGMATLNAAQRLLTLSDVRDVRWGEQSPSVGLATIALPGAVGKLLWQALFTLLARHPDLTVLVADGTRLFMDAPELATFTRAGGKLYAMRRIEVIGVALNPCSPSGGHFGAQDFLAQARAHWPHLRIADVMQTPTPLLHHQEEA